MPRSKAADWQRDHDGRFSGATAGTSGLSFFRLNLPCPVDSPLTRMKLLFMSDFHIRSSRDFHFSAAGIRPGCDFPWLRRTLLETVRLEKPDVFLFGGDLVGESSWMEEAYALLAELPDSMTKIAVPGNWDWRRRRWLSPSVWQNAYREIGFHLLINQEFCLPGIRFFGLDDYKMGHPRYFPPAHSSNADIMPEFQCLVSHNPDAVPYAMRDSDIRSVDLILCGHTHGGQIRIPGFGPFKTSSRYGRHFERGLYRYDSAETRMVISAGLGTTWLPVRLFCPPDAVVVTFSAQK